LRPKLWDGEVKSAPKERVTTVGIEICTGAAQICDQRNENGELREETFGKVVVIGSGRDRLESGGQNLLKKKTKCRVGIAVFTTCDGLAS
jgi:hypothetical protein